MGGLHAGVAAVEDYATEVGSVFQNPKTQYFHANSTDELAFPCENAGMEPGEIRRRIRERLRAFDVEHLRDRNIADCSGGQQQQLAVVAATMLDPGCSCSTSRRAIWTRRPWNGCATWSSDSNATASPS